MPRRSLRSDGSGPGVRPLGLKCVRKAKARTAQRSTCGIRFSVLTPLKDTFTVVLAGLWNTQIFHARWLAKNVFQEEGVTLEVPTVPGLPQRFGGSDVTLVPGPSRVTVLPGRFQQDSLTHAEGIAHRVVELLPHTPLQAIGYNFGFAVEEADTSLLRRFRDPDLGAYTDAGFVSVRYSVVRSLERDGTTLNLSAQVAEGRLEFHFNYHSDIENAEDALAAMPPGRFWNLLQDSRDLLMSVYELEEPEVNDE